MPHQHAVTCQRKEHRCRNFDNSSLIMFVFLCCFSRPKNAENILHLIRRRKGEKEGERKAERERVEWFWVLGYAGGLRALRNTAKMKQAAEHRGKAPIQHTIISQQSYAKKAHLQIKEGGKKVSVNGWDSVNTKKMIIHRCIRVLILKNVQPVMQISQTPSLGYVRKKCVFHVVIVKLKAAQHPTLPAWWGVLFLQ